jgi:ABC-2 type transport system ATP-binding protein
MIKVDNLVKYYGPFKAVHDLSFDLPKGSILGFLGPNGAGKTTTMRIITGFMPATSGTITVDGYDIFTSPLLVKSRIGYLPEIPPLYPEMNVKGYLNFVGRLKGVPGSERKSKVEQVVEQCGLKEKYTALIRSLSKGYRQRVGLAQALVHDPQVLILDEPTIGLDPRQIIEIRDLIHGLGEKRTIILSTHILQEVTMICDRVLIIHKGRLVAYDTLEALTTKMNLEEAFLKLVGEAEDSQEEERKREELNS